MIPIYEQGTGRGIGHGLDSFLERFASICDEHLEQGRAKAFAFIFYDFTNDALRQILRDQGVFARLDRLAGTNLSIFYLHSGSAQAVESFNSYFFRELGIEEQASLPCVVFFRVHNGVVEDVEIAQLESADLIHGFSELYESIEPFVRGGNAAPSESRAIRWLKGGTRFLGAELFRAALRRGLEFW